MGLPMARVMEFRPTQWICDPGLDYTRYDNDVSGMNSVSLAYLRASRLSGSDARKNGYPIISGVDRTPI